MVLDLFILIAWLIMSVYVFVPKKLSMEENILLFFFFTIITINIFTILDLNLGLIQHSHNVVMFISFWLHRSIIIPLALIIFVNLILNLKSGLEKIITTVIVFLIVYLVNLLAFGIGLMTCSCPNLYFASAIVLAVLMLLAFLTMKLVTKLPEGRSS